MMSNTMTSDWKAKLSPRAKGRVQIAMNKSDNETDFNEEVKNPGIPSGDLLTKKEFSMTGNFPAQRNFGLQSQDKNRQTVYNNGGKSVSPH